MAFAASVARPEVPAAPAFDALITPHRSLSSRGLLALFAAILTVAIVVQIGLVYAGCWIGAAFVGVDAVLLLVALIACRTGGGSERVAVDEGVVRVERRGPRGAVFDRRDLPVFGLVLERHLDPDYGERHLILRHRGTRHEIARDLAPAERTAFADAFTTALGGGVRIERHRLPALTTAG